MIPPGVQYAPLVSRSLALQIRLSEDEKTGFQAAADLAGIALSAWVRERLRRAAIEELRGARQDVPFLDSCAE